jgi:hypothetical protein
MERILAGVDRGSPAVPFAPALLAGQLVARTFGRALPRAKLPASADHGATGAQALRVRGRTAAGFGFGHGEMVTLYWALFQSMTQTTTEPTTVKRKSRLSGEQVQPPAGLATTLKMTVATPLM